MSRNVPHVRLADFFAYFQTKKQYPPPPTNIGGGAIEHIIFRPY